MHPFHEFQYRGDALYCEGVRISDITAKVGTPVYIYSYKTLVEHMVKLQKAFCRLRPLICYSMKANSNLAVLKVITEAGAGLDVVSGGELYRAKRVGCAPDKIVYAGVGKSKEEIEDALRYGILLFNVESPAELDLIEKVAERFKKKTSISLRINPGIDPHTHDHIATGREESKFGMDIGTAREIFLKRSSSRWLDLAGVHVHIGSQIISGEPFVEAFRKILTFIGELEQQGMEIRYVNLGGGLGVIYSNERPQTARQFASKILPLFRKKKYRLILEPGRFVTANAGILVGRVLFIKTTKVKNFAIVDIGMNDLLRPTLYGAYHEIYPLRRKSSAERWMYDVVGPICESGDFLAKDRYLPELKAGDHLALMTAGAYGFVMASNYNSRPRPAEVLVRGREFAVIRKRESYQNLVQGETMPAFLSHSRRKKSRRIHSS